MTTNYGKNGVKRLTDKELDAAVAEAIGWPLINPEGTTEEPYYLTEDGGRIYVNTWSPTTKPRQFLKLMLDYRIGVMYVKERKRWKATGCVDHSAEVTDTEYFVAYGIMPSDALCRCLIRIREAGGKSFYEKTHESLHSTDD